jgi:predicted DNA-binding transcriptional regulator AlpA
MQGQKSADRLVTTYEASNILCCSPAWLERQRWKGEPPAYVKVGGQGGRMVRYRLSDLLAWIDANLVGDAVPLK